MNWEEVQIIMKVRSSLERTLEEMQLGGKEC
jgi:hypothetical protein